MRELSSFGYVSPTKKGRPPPKSRNGLVLNGIDPHERVTPWAQTGTMLCWIENRRPFGRFEVEVAQAQCAGQGDVLGLADVEALALERVQRRLARGADRRKLLLDPFRINDSPLDMVERHRVGCEEDRVVFPGPVEVRAERTSLEDAADAVHDLKHELLADDRVADHLWE